MIQEAYVIVTGLSLVSLFLVPFVKRTVQNDLYQMHPWPLATRIACAEMVAAYHMMLQVTGKIHWMDKWCQE